MKQLLFIFLIGLIPASSSYGQLQKPHPDTLNIIFRDTVFNIAFDSLKNDLGLIDPRNTRMVKYMKYVGKEEVSIIRTFTSDPHFICGYPKGPLIPGKVYAVKICFYHQGKEGSKMNKVMGFNLSDGNQVMIHLKGTYPPLPPAPIKHETRNPEPLPAEAPAKEGDTVTGKPNIPNKPLQPFDSNLVEERMASFPGGNDSFYAFIKRHFNPELVKKINQKGLIVLAIKVNVDGSLSDFAVKKSLHPELDQELIRVMKKSPKWIPGVCSKVDPGFYLDPNEAYYYCEAVFHVPFRIDPGAW